MAITVVKRQFKTTCSKCKSLLIFEDEDKKNKIVGNYSIDYINCPECGTEAVIYFADFVNIDRPSKYYDEYYDLR